MKNEIIAELENFYNKYYFDKLNYLAYKWPEVKSLEVDFEDLEEYDPELVDLFLNEPDKFLEYSKKAIEDIGIVLDIDKNIKLIPNIRVFNLPKEKIKLVRNLKSDEINKVVVLDGLITQITTIIPHLKTACYRCNYCGEIYHVDMNNQGEVQLGECSCGRKSFSIVMDRCKFIDFQKAQLREPLEKIKGATQAQAIDLYVYDDLTNTVLPGEKVIIVGILRLKKPKKQKQGFFDKYIEVIHIQKLDKEFEELEITKEDLEKIKELSRDPYIFEKIRDSMAPAVFGHEKIKEAIALQLFGGTPGKKLPDGTEMRSNFHILLIGDPGAAKSRLLKYVKNLAPKSIYVSGKSATGGGLTAIAEKDEFAEGGWTIKAGALVLASGGIALIDEFDKMSDSDKSALHEAMESGTLSIAKAGIVTTFRADASILAAANPKFGRFDKSIPPSEQFNIPPTILSRFDLIFPIYDNPNKDHDLKIAEHILNAHMIASGSEDVDDEAIEKITPMIDIDLLRKYIAYARKNIKPKLTKEAKEKITFYYLKMRELGKKTGTIPITARYLEGLIRLAEASAKLRLDEYVREKDAEKAIELVEFFLRNIGQDPETGNIDIDIITTGRPTSKTEKIKTLLSTIRKLDKEIDEITFDVLCEELKGKIEEEEIEEILENLIRSGDVYCPRHDVYKPT